MDSAVIPTKEELSAHNPYTYEASLTLYYSILVEFIHTIIDPGSLSRMHIPLDLTWYHNTLIHLLIPTLHTYNTSYTFTPRQAYHNFAMVFNLPFDASYQLDYEED